MNPEALLDAILGRVGEQIAQNVAENLLLWVKILSLLGFVFVCLIGVGACLVAIRLVVGLWRALFKRKKLPVAMLVCLLACFGPVWAGDNLDAKASWPDSAKKYLGSIEDQIQAAKDIFGTAGSKVLSDVLMAEFSGQIARIDSLEARVRKLECELVDLRNTVGVYHTPPGYSFTSEKSPCDVGYHLPPMRRPGLHRLED